MEIKDITLGMRVVITGGLYRVTVRPDGLVDDGNAPYMHWRVRGQWRREWRRNRRKPLEGVVVGVRSLQNGEIVQNYDEQSTWRMDGIVPAVLVSHHLRLNPVLVSPEDVEEIPSEGEPSWWDRDEDSEAES